MKGKHLGSDFDDFLREEDMLAETQAVAAKRVLAFQIGKSNDKKGSYQSGDGKPDADESFGWWTGLLDPENISVTLNTLEKAALVLGKKLSIRLG